MIQDSPDLWREAEFRKSSFSGANGGDCVELGWRKSSLSGANGGACAETVFGIRDSKCADGPVLMMGETQGRSFLAAVKRHR